ncbi:hypothetical protein MRY87_06560 [bacterium]|nr:hypothetical protein [bacterium]
MELAEARDRPQEGRSDWILDVSIMLKVGVTPTPQVLNRGIDIPAMQVKREKWRQRSQVVLTQQEEGGARQLLWKSKVRATTKDLRWVTIFAWG